MVEKQQSEFTPDSVILRRYADVIVNFALGGGAGIKAGETVLLVGHEASKPLFLHICEAITIAGGNVIPDYRLDETDMFGTPISLYKYATAEQLDFFPARRIRGTVDDIDHYAAILDQDPLALQVIDPDKVNQRKRVFKPWMDWRQAKENAGQFTWTVGLYGTPALAQESGMPIGEYWDQIIKACFLDENDPVAKWRETEATLKALEHKLNSLPIDKLHVEGEDADLWITLGEQRRWLSGGGRNIPSFEVFTSPDWRGTNGWIKFNEPLMHNGTKISGIRLEFKNGLVTGATATENQRALESMIRMEGANRIGEFSLTDGRLSRLNRRMGHTLYDENIGGRYGNTHLALGAAYRDTFRGNISKVSEEEWARLGFNDSSEHADVISTVDRKVTAILHDGSEAVIYQDGQFQL